MIFNKNYSLFILLFILLSVVVSADVNWFQEANSDNNVGGGNGFTGYATNYNNIADTVNYSMCTIGGVSYTPIAADFDKDGITEILITKNTRLELYSLDCEFINEISLGTTVRAMPVLVNFDEDAYQEIIILTDSTVQMWRYNIITEAFVQMDVKNYTTDTGTVDLDFITCPRSSEHNSVKSCIAFNKNTDDVYVIDYFAGNVTKKPDEFGDNIFNFGFSQGISNARTLGNSNWQIPFCNSQGGSTTNQLTCKLLNGTGDFNGIETGNIATASFAVEEINYHSVWFAKMGSLNRIFVNIEYDKAANRYITIAYDSAFTQLHRTNVVGFDTVNMTSNWMVGDYNKDGTSDACYLINISNDMYFRCYDSNFLSLLVNQDVTDKINFSRSFVMADFDINRSTLGIANEEGIYYLNGSDVETLFSTGRSTSVDDRFSAIVVTSGTSGNPAYIYADDTSGFIVRNNLVTSSCGDGVCQAYENAFSCAVDCGVNVSGLYDEDSVCSNNSQCDSGYCIGGVCTLAPEGYSCTTGDICLSGVCSNGECTKPAIDDSLKGFFGSMLGTDSETLNFIAIIIIILGFVAITGSVYYMTSHAGISALAGGISVLLLSLVMLVWGWLSGWIFLIGFLFLLIVGFIMLMLRTP